MDREELLAELRAQLHFREKVLDLLHAIDLRLLGDDPLNVILGFIVERTQELLGSDHTRILLRSGRFLESAYSTAKSDLGQRLDIATSVEGRSLTTDSTINIVYADKAVMVTPIRVGDTVTGVLATQCENTDTFGRDQEAAFVALAAMAAITTQRARLFDRDALSVEIDNLILAPGDAQQAINAALHRVMRSLQELEHVSVTSAQIIFRHGDYLEIAHSTDPADIGIILDLDESMAGRAIREGRTVIIGDVADEGRRAPAPDRSEIVVPIFLGEDAVTIGVLSVSSSEPDAFQGFSQVILENFADKTRILLAFAKLRSDITEAVEIQHASELLIAIGDQTSNIIHRLNNSVGAMRVRILEMQDRCAEDQADAAELMPDFLEQMRELAERTLQMPDSVTALLAQEGRTLDVNEVIQASLFSIDIPDDIAVQVELSPELPMLSLYSFDIVIRNLIQNALDAMPEGGTLTISTSAVRDKGSSRGFVQIIVNDDGVGMPEEILPRIFDLNFTTKRVKDRGMGLGLWWTRNFLRRARGDISVTSTRGQGTSVVVKLPFTSSPQPSGSLEGH
jgi:signal transduction histidine kinase